MHESAFTRRRFIGAADASLALPAAAAGIGGGKPITLVVSYPAGGGADVMARLIAPRMADALGQPVIVDNKPGASGTIAAGLVARAAPDGTTLLLDASSFAVNPALFGKLPYDTATAFTPLAVLALFPNVMVCPPGFEARTVADVIRLARAKPGSLAYASSGNGSAQHLAGVLFEQTGQGQLTHVPYRGGGPALNDVMGGQVQLFFGNVASTLGFIQSGAAARVGRHSRRCAAAPCRTFRRWSRRASRGRGAGVEPGAGARRCARPGARSAGRRRAARDGRPRSAGPRARARRRRVQR